MCVVLCSIVLLIATTMQIALSPSEKKDTKFPSGFSQTILVKIRSIPGIDPVREV